MGVGIARGGPTTEPGTVDYFAMSSPPPGWLVCDGATLSRSTYARLFARIGTTYGAGDGVTTFQLPDDRGEFLRSWDGGRGVDGGRAFGSWQGQDIQSHSHPMPRGDAGWNNGGGNAFWGPNYDTTTGWTGGGETRPRNRAYLTCIKF